jgi:predicted DNA-binding transcriptional regulator AlpA
MTEILTIRELCEWLKMTEPQVRSMLRKRGQARMSYPLPSIRLNSNVRFVRSDIETWLLKIREEHDAEA